MDCPEPPHRNAEDSIEQASCLIRSARNLIAFTGAGISVESGIPPFRGAGGLWERYDPRLLELAHFRRHPRECWEVLRKLFYDHLAQAQPNEAHRILARWETCGLLKAVITQNIDNLHAQAGSRNVFELHGCTRSLSCIQCGRAAAADPVLLAVLPPRCTCGGVLKPDIVFFGEELPQQAWLSAQAAVEASDVLLVIGSTGEVYPAASLPFRAAEQGASIIEINPKPSGFTGKATDVFIALAASPALSALARELGA